LYVSTNKSQPGSINALDPATGRILWHTKNPQDGCTTGGAATAGGAAAGCDVAMPAPPTSSPGLVYQGSADGRLRIYNSRTGSKLWEYDTVRAYTGINGVAGQGGSINGSGVTLSEKMLYVNSGYLIFPGSGLPGNVLLAFSLN
jgi:polyvinyl alcohol dehydrogenase (cytochrome)